MVKEEAGAVSPQDNVVAASMLITIGTGGELNTHDGLLVGINEDSRVVAVTITLAAVDGAGGFVLSLAGAVGLRSQGNMLKYISNHA